MATGVVLKGVKEVISMFDAMTKRMERPDVSLKIIGDMGRQDVLQHFKDESGPEGRWKSLAPQTIERRRKGKKKRGDKILQDSGDMRDRVNYKVVGGKAIVYVNVFYAKYHDQPEGPGKGIMPKREFMWISDAKKDEIRKFFAAFIAGR